MRNHETIVSVLEAVKKGGLLGVTSLEVTETTGIQINRTTAALTRLTDLGCVKRDKLSGKPCRFRYYYVRPMATPTARPRIAGYQPDVPAALIPKPPAPRTRWGVDASGVSIRLAIGPRGNIAVTPSQAREVWQQLRVIFGD